MKKFIYYFTFVFCLIGFVSLGWASKPDQKISQNNAASTESASSKKQKFNNLKRYNDEKYSPYADELFKDKEIQGALKKLLNNNYSKLIENLASIDITEPLVDSRGILTVKGWVQGLRTTLEAIFIIEPEGNIYVAILDSGKQILYFTNDKTSTHRLPASIEQWKSRFSNVPVQFKSK